MDYPTDQFHNTVQQLLTSKQDLARINGCMLYILYPDDSLITTLFNSTIHIRNPSLTMYGVVALIQTWSPEVIALHLAQLLEDSAITDTEIDGINSIFYWLGGLSVYVWCNSPHYMYLFTEHLNIISLVVQLNRNLSEKIYAPDLMPRGTAYVQILVDEHGEIIGEFSYTIIAHLLPFSDHTTAFDTIYELIERITQLFLTSQRVKLQIACIRILKSIDLSTLNDYLRQKIIQVYNIANVSEIKHLQDLVATQEYQDLLS